MSEPNYIVQNSVRSAMDNDPTMAASLLRLHFHDCFVNGCDGSVLLDGNEKNARPNINSFRGFEVIDTIKSNVEEACPAAVSRTDILTLVALEAVILTGGPSWNVPLGRWDGLTASEDAADQQIPRHSVSLENITAKFTSKGLDFKDVVVLSGAHTIGSTRKSRSNPTPLDPSPSKFANQYYQQLLNNSGVLLSDRALVGDIVAASLVANCNKNLDMFFEDFGVSMVKMASIGVLTGPKGEITKNCRAVNKEHDSVVLLCNN